MSNDAEHQEHDPGVAGDDVEHEVGAEGGSDSADTPTPFHPHEDDDSALGDTDQHSKA